MNILNYENHSYHSSLTFENLKHKTEKLFEQKSLKLGGKLTSSNEFTIHDNLNVIAWNMPNLKRKAAYLKAHISENEKGTLVKLKVNPNLLFPVFSILSTIVGLALITFITLYDVQDYKFIEIAGFVFIFVGIVYYPLSTFFRKRLRDKIVKHLDLKKI